MELFYVAVLTVWLGSIGMGMNLGYSSPAMPSMTHGNATGGLTITPEQKSWFGSLMTTGALAGGLGAGFLVDLLGRKMSIVISSLGFISGYDMIATANSVGTLYGGRV